LVSAGDWKATPAQKWHLTPVTVWKQPHYRLRGAGRSSEHLQDPRVDASTPKTFCDGQAGCHSGTATCHLQFTHHEMLNPNLQSFSHAVSWETRPHHCTGSSGAWCRICFLPLAVSPLVHTHHTRKTIAWTHKVPIKGMRPGMGYEIRSSLKCLMPFDTLLTENNGNFYFYIPSFTKG